jgi:hypothetical protein
MHRASSLRAIAKLLEMCANNAINSDVQKRRFALFLPAGYGER